MICGIGSDIIEISRIRKISNSTSFVEKHFTKNETNYFEKNGVKSIAASFAAKEAFAKAVGTGFVGFKLSDIEILHDELGKPFIKLYNNALELAKNKVIHLTLSHCNEYAMAVVVIEDGE